MEKVKAESLMLRNIFKICILNNSLITNGRIL
jgi:hypothetical protein